MAEKREPSYTGVWEEKGYREIEDNEQSFEALCISRKIDIGG
jgi:hypothetical protein